MEYLNFADRLRSIVIRAQKYNQSRDDVLIELSFMMSEYEDRFEELECEFLDQEGVK
jgi:hypothetical protein